MIMAQGASVTVIDSNPEQIERTASFGMKVYYGDGSRVDLLRRAGAEEANLIVYCVNGEWLGASVIEAVRQAFPQAAVLARVFDRRHLLALDGAELNGMVREVWESAILLRSEEHTSELQSLMRISYGVFCLKKKKKTTC